MDTPYRHWQRQTRRLLEPLAALMHPGRADLPIAGPASDHDAQADRLESFARPLLLAAHYLQSAPEENGTAADSRAFRQRLARWFREALVAGSNPHSPQYFGPDASYHQHHVEMGLLSVALQIAPRQLWEPLEPAEKDQVAAWLATSRGSGIVNNNHLFMSVHILEFLGKHGYGHRTDRAVIAKHLDQLETMHRGGGWFEDGINQAFDHYNAYAFHFYGLWWARLHGAGDPARAQRWRDWARMFVNDYHHFFAASGEHPAFGRSMMYRFNAINVFGLAAAEGCTDVPPGLLRRLCTRSLDFFLARPITQEQGCLAFGWTDHFNDLAESYSCAASPYWCAKGLAALLLPPDHAFWTAPEQPLAAEQGDFVHLIPSAGLAVRGIGGEVEILNAGSMVSNSQLRYGAWKWSKLAYRTGVSFTLSKGPPPTDWSLDNALTQQLDDGRVFGRHSTVCVEMDREHLGYAYSLGFKTGQVNTGVETFLWWRAGWLLSVHLVDARQPVVLRLGGYALPLAADALPSLQVDGGPSTPLRAFAGARGTALQPLLGFARAAWDNRLEESTKRTHIHAPYHATPLVETVRLSGRTALAALAWTGSTPADAAPWTVVKGAPGQWELSHPTLPAWALTHWSLPALPFSRSTP
ncbi:MAG TPA: DUF2264 domain-containing protein [Opitutaceae bacterium]